MACKSEGCDKKHHALGYCRKHRTRFKRNGTDVSKYDMDKNSNEILDFVKDTGKNRRGYLYVNIINDLKYKALQRGKVWNLSHKEAFELITSSCVYCGFKPDWPKNRVGIDRVDNSKGYEITNCLPCCFSCNSAKGQKSLDEFMQWIENIYFNCFKKAA